jgi:hypothetical protein
MRASLRGLARSLEAIVARSVWFFVLERMPGRQWKAEAISKSGGGMSTYDDDLIPTSASDANPSCGTTSRDTGRVDDGGGNYFQVMVKTTGLEDIYRFEYVG